MKIQAEFSIWCYNASSLRARRETGGYRLYLEVFGKSNSLTDSVKSGGFFRPNL